MPEFHPSMKNAGKVNDKIFRDLVVKMQTIHEADHFYLRELEFQSHKVLPLPVVSSVSILVP